MRGISMRRERMNRVGVGGSEGEGGLEKGGGGEEAFKQVFMHLTEGLGVCE
jgi:hypothetical protein